MVMTATSELSMECGSLNNAAQVANEVCKNMAEPRAGDLVKIKRVVRFFKGAGMVKFLYVRKNEETRKSTSGGVLKVVEHVIHTRSSTQPTVWQHRVEKPSSSRCVMVRHGGRGCRR